MQIPDGSHIPTMTLRAAMLYTGCALLIAAIAGITRWWRYHRSPIERALARAISRSDLPAPTAQFKVFEKKKLVTIPDFAYPTEKIAIFCDGWSSHGKESVAISDAKKRNYLARTGWIVLVFHGRTIYGQPNYCIREIHEALKCADEFPNRG